MLRVRMQANNGLTFGSCSGHVCFRCSPGQKVEHVGYLCDLLETNPSEALLWEWAR